jgi:protein-S-isoprenylcysteine O-methyltransferase Ste14
VTDIRSVLFTYRSYTPIPFLLAMILYGEPTTDVVIAGGLVGLLGELLRFWGVAYAGPLTRVTGSVGAPKLIVAGPFAYTRNPLYVGNLLLYGGLALMANALVPWLFIATVLFFFLQYRLIVSLEEEFLATTFPGEFSDYVKHVPRFFPRLTPYTSPASETQRPDWKGALRSEARTLQAIALMIIILLALWYRS